MPRAAGRARSDRNRRNVVELLAEAGIEYVADWVLDDQPVELKTRSRPIVSVPYTVEINDVVISAVQQQPSDEILRRGKDQFDRLYLDGAKAPRVHGDFHPSSPDRGPPTGSSISKHFTTISSATKASSCGQERRSSIGTRPNPKHPHDRDEPIDTPKGPDCLAWRHDHHDENGGRGHRPHFDAADLVAAVPQLEHYADIETVLSRSGCPARPDALLLARCRENRVFGATERAIVTVPSSFRTDTIEETAWAFRLSDRWLTSRSS